MDEQEIEHLSILARIDLRVEEKQALMQDLPRILLFVGQITDSGVEGSDTAVVGKPHNILRNDSNPHESGMYTELLLQEAPDQEGGYIKVKNIL